MYKRTADSLVYSPSDLTRFMESAWVTWMDRFHCEFPGAAVPDKPSETDEMLQKKGIAHEESFLRQLVEDGVDVCDVSKCDDRFDATVRAMRQGTSVIYQAALRDEQFTGYADFLILADGESQLGSYHYEPWDTKLALSPKPYFIVQLACYADLLRGYQGRLPERMSLILGDGEKETYRTEDFIYFYRELRRAFLDQQHQFDPNNPPDFTGREKFGRWTSHAETLIKTSDHLCQVANIRALQIRKLKESGITTLSQLATTTVPSVAKLQSDTYSILRQQARLQVESADKEKPSWEIVLPQTEGSGLHLLPSESPADVFFDMEGYPLIEGGLEYLFGATIVENCQPHFVDWWAHTPEEEKRAFESFIDWLYARWQHDQTMHVYHYAAYEKNAMRKLSSKYATRQDEVDALLRNEVFVDLFTIIRQSIKVGTPNYSLKSIEKLYREKRDSDVATAMDSIVFYQRWLDHNDGPEWQSSPLLRQIREYNKDDCDSTLQLYQWLRRIQTEAKISWRPREHKESPQTEAAKFRSKAAALVLEMLKDIPTDRPMPKDLVVQELLAHLLEFHWREAKPVFWAKYDRHEMTEQELFEDPSCLAGLVRTGVRTSIDRSYGYEYWFDSDQDTKIAVGDSCFYSHDLKQTITVAHIDPDNGTVVLKRGFDGTPPPDRLSLIKDEYVSADEIAKSVFEIASKFMRTGVLPPAIDDFLRLNPPKVRRFTSRELIDPSAKSIADETAKLLETLDGSTLCIQGPPGSGKTYTAAKAIVHLLKLGKTVGVTSTSHKAIAHLMDKVAAEAQSCRLELKAVKVQNESEDFHVTAKSIQAQTTKAFFQSPQSWQLIGGTAWTFSKKDAIDLLDYLFVDEAGQVSMANLVGMSRSTHNIVLIGDQMQLAQPLQGVHPGDSGKSSLEYLLGPYKVIPSDFGIFLGTSHRMHPEVCKFISGAVYEDRLQSHPDCANRVLKIPPSAAEFITKSAGVLFVPVSHDGNTQDSDEEADMIAQLVSQLDQCVLKDGDSERPFDIERDLLIVAPYNMQVRKLKQRIPGAKVGSVDKFQGQEAAVVIVSMCSSKGDASARGLEFIFSKNRLNVALSRAQTLAVVVGSPDLARTHCKRVRQMELVNLFCRIVEQSVSHHDDASDDVADSELAQMSI